MTAAAPPRTRAAVQVHPVIRKARLCVFEPRLEARRARHYAERLKQAWDAAEAGFLDAAARAARTSPEQIRWIDEERVERVGIHNEGTTIVVDFPRYACSRAALPFDTRACIAFCTGEMSSKAWSRVGPPLGDRKTRITLDGFASAWRAYDELASACSDWLAGWMLDVLQPLLRADGRDVRRAAERLEIHTVGSDDPRISDELAKLSHPLVDEPDLVKHARTRSLFGKYFAVMASSADVLSSPSALATWKRAPVQIALEDRTLEHRHVLYLLRDRKGSTHAFGLGYDGDGARELAQKSSLNLARELARKT